MTNPFSSRSWNYCLGVMWDQRETPHGIPAHWLLMIRTPFTILSLKRGSGGGGGTSQANNHQREYLSWCDSQHVTVVQARGVSKLQNVINECEKPVYGLKAKPIHMHSTMKGACATNISIIALWHIKGNSGMIWIWRNKSYAYTPDGRLPQKQKWTPRELT